METLIYGLVVICVVAQVVTLSVVARFILLIEDMHKREFRKNNTKN